MADSINALNGQGMSLQFEKFAQLAASASKDTSAVRFLGAEAFGGENNIPGTVNAAMKPGTNDMTSLKSGLMPQSTREYNPGVVTFNGQNIPDGTTGKPYYAPDSDLGDKNPEFTITEIKQEVV